jgi:DNA-binding transcriptional regulator LsrR (DeoR family)
VEDERVRAALLGEPSVEPIVEAWRALDVAIVGVGRAPEPAAGHLYVGEYLQDRTLASAAVGDVCSHYFGVDGRPLGSDRDAQLVAVSREQLERTPLVIGISGGREKIGAIVGAMRGRLINALVTDEATANGCLQIAKAA